MKFVLIALLLTHILSQLPTLTPIDLSDPSTTAISFPVSQTVGYQLYHNLKNPNFTGIPAAKWIYVAGSDAWPNGYQVNFVSLFFADCPQVGAQLRITADNNFTAYLNGVLVGSGNNWQKLYTFNLSLLCGPNNLTVVTFNLDANSPAALIFVIVQDQSHCYQCTANPSAFYNRQTCQCQCSTRCHCLSKFQHYFGYPYCGCICDYPRSCVPSRYFDQSTCACRCIPRLCAPNFFQNLRTCRCVCLPVSCLPGLVQNRLTCACVRE